ncbi:hypothetical protein [uncultured Tateyamaria sp.]|uniref:hypothetical protein n=1 Tax=uncultured Tateyamaria sp. TaxID=455651 RepID=UPI00261BDE92|nr:hypothetical protein [uncultured Tateyamaria sp.]
MIRSVAAIILALSLWVPPVTAQQAGWPNLDQLLFSTLTASGRAEASFWLPDRPEPTTATRALGVVYEHIPGSAGSVSIAVGLYQRVAEGWAFVGPVEGLFGNSPREVEFGPTSLDLTTTMLGPNEPRCCPTLPVRWRIDLATRVAQRLN